MKKAAVSKQVAAVEHPEPPTSTPPLQERTHVIQQGDNLFRIGIKYNVSWKSLMQSNALSDPDSIHVGQTLKIPLGEPTKTENAPPPSEGEKRSGLQTGHTVHR